MSFKSWPLFQRFRSVSPEARALHLVFKLMSPHKSTGTAWTHQRAAFSGDSLFVQTGVRWRVFERFLSYSPFPPLLQQKMESAVCLDWGKALCRKKPSQPFKAEGAGASFDLLYPKKRKEIVIWEEKGSRFDLWPCCLKIMDILSVPKAVCSHLKI